MNSPHQVHLVISIHDYSILTRNISVLVKTSLYWMDAMAHICKPNFCGGGDGQDHGSR
jgi:hypothetical protein